MKISGKFLACVMLLGLVAASPAFAKQGDKAVDLTFDVATEPVAGFGSTVGFTVGAGYEVMDNLQLRGDFSYYNWSQDVGLPGFGSSSISVTRIPLDLGARYYFQLPPKGLKVYPLAALEISFDSFETAVAIPFFGVAKQSVDEVNAGVVMGGGVDYAFTKEFSVGANMKGHILSDSYVTLGFGGTYHF